jgi:predicted DNA-binding transcriptional regulator AlpA
MTIDQLLDTVEVARLLGVHPQTLAAWRSQSQGPRWIKVGRKVKYQPSDIDAWIGRNKHTSTRVSQ